MVFFWGLVQVPSMCAWWVLFQVQFQGPETDAFFADMSPFTGSKLWMLQRCKSQRGMCKPCARSLKVRHLDREREQARYVVATTVLPHSCGVGRALLHRYDPRSPSLKGASKGDFSKGLQRGASKGLEAPFEKGPHPSRFSSEAPLEASLRRKREGLLEAPLRERREAPFEKEGVQLLVSREGGASRRGASRRGLWEGGLLEGGFEKGGFSKGASRRGPSRRGLREGGLLEGGFEKGGFSKGASRRGASRRGLREGGLLEGGFEKGGSSLVSRSVSQMVGSFVSQLVTSLVRSLVS